MRTCGTLFVYGTLMVGHAAHGLIAPWVRGVRAARGRGRLFLMPPGYPALVRSAADEVVHGQLLELDLGWDWARLDAYEACDPDDPDGSLYQRSVLPFELPDGTTRSAWCYWMPSSSEARITSEGARWLPGGRWPPSQG